MAKRTYNRRGRQTAKTPVTSSKRRPQRIKGAQTARDTGSKDRMTRGRGVTRTATGGPRGAQGPANPPVQGPNRAVKGLIGSRNTPATKTVSGPPKVSGKTVRTAAKVGTLINPRSDVPAKVAAAASLVADALASRKPSAKKGSGKPMASRGKDYKAKEKDLSRKAAASNFDQAFAKARKAGKKTFTWRGKKYTTKMK
jgi:hypothetical protein